MKLTKKQLITELKNVSRWNESDYEKAHRTADELLIKFINDEEVKKAYENVGRWYA